MNQPDFSYNLNLTRDYVSHWGLKEAVRELVANNIDEHGKIELLGDKSMGILRLTTDHELPLEAFLMGYSAKSTDKPIGQYGEGLKLAMLVLARENRSYVLSSGQYSYAFVFKTAAGFGVSTLHVERYKRIEDEYDEFILSEEQAKTCIIVYGVDKSRLDSVYNPAPLNSVIPGINGLFCQGLMVEPTFYLTIGGISYGVNLDVSLKGNRDRNYFQDKKLIVPIIEKSFKPADLLNMHTSWSESNVYESLTTNYKRRVVEAYIRKNTPEYAEENLDGLNLLLPSNYGIQYQRREDVVIASPPWWMGHWLMTQQQRELMKELEIDDAIEEEESDDERDVKLRKRIRLMLEDLSLSKDLNDFTESMSNYLPRLKDYRKDVRDFLKMLVVSIVYDDMPRPAIPTSLDEDEDE